MAFSDDMKIVGGPVAQKHDCDLYLLSAGITEARADRLITNFCGLKVRRPNVGLVLVTNGGSADAAFQIARYLKRKYKHFTLYVFGNCKSAGTLIAVGASEIVMSDCGQLGPLDVQLSDTKEFFGQTAALDVSQGLTTLSNTAREVFAKNFMDLEPGRGISTKLASEIAISLAGKIVEPIASQIDPLLLGRVDRSMQVAEAYGKRLAPEFKGIKRLVGEYPAHEFVIDFEEAREIFGKVREPDNEELALEHELRDYQFIPNQKNFSWWISEPLPAPVTTPATNPSATP